MYALSKRVISQYIRTGCRRRLRLDLYGSDAARRTSDVPLKDAARPGLRLLTEQGRQFEREKFAELLELFPGHVLSGAREAFRGRRGARLSTDGTARADTARPAQRLAAGE